MRLLQKKRDRQNEETQLAKDIERLDDLFILDMSDNILEQELNKKKRENWKRFEILN